MDKMPPANATVAATVTLLVVAACTGSESVPSRTHDVRRLPGAVLDTSGTLEHHSVDVPLTPPDSVPADVWRNADPEGVFALDIVVIQFQLDATLSQKREAIQAISGRVVGGMHIDDAVPGLYIVRIPFTGRLEAVDSAVARLDRSPGVQFSMPWMRAFIRGSTR